MLLISLATIVDVVVLYATVRVIEGVMVLLYCTTPFLLFGVVKGALIKCAFFIPGIFKGVIRGVRLVFYNPSHTHLFHYG